MAGLGQFGAWRHIVVGASIGAVALAVGTGLIGQDNSEHFDSKQVVVSPAGDAALHLHEVADIDFGHQSRHGYQRDVPNDFGVPTKVQATATDAPDDVSVTEYASTTLIRVGDPTSRSADSTGTPSTTSCPPSTSRCPVPPTPPPASSPST